MLKIASIALATLFLLLPQPAAAAVKCATVLLEYSYVPAYPTRGNAVREKLKVELPKLDALKGVRTDEAGVGKTIFTLKLIAAFERAIEKFDHRQVFRPYPWWGPIYRPLLDESGLPSLVGHLYMTPDVEEEAAGGTPEVAVTGFPSPGQGGFAPRRPRPQPAPDVITRNKQLAVIFRAEFKAFEAYLNADRTLAKDEELADLIALGFKLADNMDKWDGGGDQFLETMRGGAAMFSMSAAAPKALGVAAGGAQDAGKFRKVIEAGRVPEKEAFSAEGLLREFNLNISFTSDSLLAVKPAYLIDPKEKVVYIQLNTGSNVTDANFKRNPVNVTFALDISGSMSATDGTPHSRIEWAKASVKTMLRKLRKGDTVSIILFDDKTDVFLEPTEVSKISMDDLEARIQAEIKQRGSTDVEKAMVTAVEFAKRQQVKRVAGRAAGVQVENRIVLVSDAGHNTGGTREGITKLVREAADLGIGVTAIGLGETFDKALVDSFATSKGGNYLFVQNGDQMSKLFDKFDYLVQPVAEDYKVTVSMQGFPKGTQIARAWGVNAAPGDKNPDLIYVPTLFFVDTGGGGGAMVLAIRYGRPEGPAMPGDDETPTTRPPTTTTRRRPNRPALP